jgi:protein-L-isoaspartate O-methyltransferase
MLPFHLGAPDDFAAVRELFLWAGYTEPSVCARCEVPRIHQLPTIAQGRTAGTEIHDALDVLIRLFIDGIAVRDSRVESLLPRRGLDALRALRLIDRHPEHPDAYAASVLLYPTESLYVASDLDRLAPGLAKRETLEQADHVFSAVTTLTGTFIDQLPRTPCSRFLELCGGTGIAALLAARFAEHSWSLDITERCTRFAEFNARLNGIENFTALQGDLYEPVAGQQFDRIVAHPPYVPAPETRMIYRDGGEDGEQIFRRILAGLEEHLSPGGTFYCTCIATDRKDRPLEQRIRDMVGERESEFDVLVVSHYELHPTEYYCRLAASGRMSFETAEARIQLFRELGTERIVYCSMAVQRHARPREAFTLRRARAETAAGDAMQWLLEWNTAVAEQGNPPVLLDGRPRLSPHARLHTTHRVEDGDWTLESSQVKVVYPFLRTLDLSLNVATLLTLFDGSLSGREAFARLHDAGTLPAEMPEEALLEFVRELVGEGVLVLEEEHAGAEGMPAPLPTPVPPLLGTG